MFLQFIHGHPKHFVITQSPGLKMDFFGNWVTTGARNTVDPSVDFFLCAWFVAVGCIRTDDMSQFNAFSVHRLGHNVSGLLLFIDFAAVCDSWAIEKIDGVIGGVIPMPELLFPPGRSDTFTLENAEEFGRLRETGARSSGSPFAGIMSRELPACSATH